MQICETSLEEIERLRNFGTTIQNSCTFDLARLISTNKYDHPRIENFFYELYIQDYNGDLIDVPVLLRNYYDSNGNLINSANSDESGYKLTKRFFIFDTVSGVELT